MNDFWEQCTPQQLRQLETPQLPYPGTTGIIRRFRRKTQPRRRILPKVAAVAAVTALLCMGVWAGYQRWHMPDAPETYHGGSVMIREAHTYPLPQEHEATEPEALSDQWFLSQAAEIMALVDKANPDVNRATVTRQVNQLWSREEVVVSFQGGADLRDVTFDAESGYLIGVSASDPGRAGETPMDEAEALAVAQGYYDALPYARGYEFRHVEKFDDQSWMYSFDRPIAVTLWGETRTLHSAYEEVRIIIDPCTGAFQDSHCFYVPLLDDHQPEDAPLTQDEARAVAEQSVSFAQSLDQYQVTAELGVALPKPQPSSPLDNSRYYSITRLAWNFRYDGEIDGFANCYWISVDLYTGEILSVDTTG